MILKFEGKTFMYMWELLLDIIEDYCVEEVEYQLRRYNDVQSYPSS